MVLEFVRLGNRPIALDLITDLVPNKDRRTDKLHIIAEFSILYMKSAKNWWRHLSLSLFFIQNTYLAPREDRFGIEVSFLAEQKGG